MLHASPLKHQEPPTPRINSLSICGLRADLHKGVKCFHRKSFVKTKASQGQKHLSTSRGKPALTLDEPEMTFPPGEPDRDLLTDSGGSFKSQIRISNVCLKCILLYTQRITLMDIICSIVFHNTKDL